MASGRNVLVTGGAGFIGSHLVEALLEQGHKVTAFDDLSNGLESNLAAVKDKITFVKGSITDLPALLKAAKGVDTVFHLAAVSNVQQTLDDPVYAHNVNATGTLHVLEAARANNAHVVYSSSAATYGDTEPSPKTENGPTRPISLYGSQKLMGEHLLRNYGTLFGITGVSLRYFNVFGPRQRPDSPYSGVISVFADRASSNQTITVHGTGKQIRDFVHVSDVVGANLLAMEYRQVLDLPFNICSGHPIDVNGLAQAVIETFKSSSKIEHGPAREGDIQKSCGNPRLAHQRLKYEVHYSLEHGLQDLADSLAPT